MCILYSYHILDTARDYFLNTPLCALNVNLIGFHKTGTPHLSLTVHNIKQHPCQHKLKIMQVKDNCGYSPSRQHRRNDSYKRRIKGKVVLRNKERNTFTWFRSHHFEPGHVRLTGFSISIMASWKQNNRDKTMTYNYDYVLVLSF